MRTYHADIHEAPNRDGNFVAVLRGAAITTTGRDPEHDLAHAMVRAGFPDGGIQFWRGSTPSLLYRSVHGAAGYRIALGDDFPYRRAKRSEVTAETFSKPGDRFTGTGETPWAGTSGHRTLPPVPESPRTVCEAAL